MYTLIRYICVLYISHTSTAYDISSSPAARRHGGSAAWPTRRARPAARAAAFLLALRSAAAPIFYRILYHITSLQHIYIAIYDSYSLYNNILYYTIYTIYRLYTRVEMIMNYEL